MVQAQNDYLAALNVLNKARSQLALSQAAEKRLRDLYESRVTTLRELQNAQNDLTSTTNDARTAEVGLEAVRSRLRILGLRDDEVANLQKGSINPETAINAPLDGTIIQRKIGPGQYVGSGGGEPSYIIGDLSKVWLIAQLREPDAARVDLGDRIKFRVLAFPERVFDGQINFIGASVDPATRRITVRADIENTDNLLKPEMYASVRIINERETVSPSVPRSAVVLEGPKASVWVLGAGNTVQSRRVRPGIIDGGNIEILQGLAVGERVISRGSLFIDRMLTRS
jgi:cobalt-zinc-cadmium efflux system membrane fusion protein